MKTSSDTIGDGTRNLPTCDAVPQPTALPRAPSYTDICHNKRGEKCAHIFSVIDDFSFMAPQPILGQGFLWTSDQPDVETST